MDDQEIMVGDIYVFHTNCGPIYREIDIIGNKNIGYICNGRKRACLISKFKRWLNGAKLEYRKPTQLAWER